MKGKPHYFIWSCEHSAWWKPDRRGYTLNVDSAGLYTLFEARRICMEANYYCDNVPTEMMVPDWRDLADAG